MEDRCKGGLERVIPTYGVLCVVPRYHGEIVEALLWISEM